MGVGVRNFERIKYALRKAIPSGHLCCFFALDDRPSLKPALDYLYECRKWIDTFANATNIFAFFPVELGTDNTEMFFVGERIMTDEEGAYLDSLPSIDYVLNPSIQMASQFGILPKELPGVILFRAGKDELIADACFISVPEQLLTGDSKSVERFLSTFFSELIAALQDANRENLDSVEQCLRANLSQGCKVRRTGVSLDFTLTEAIEADLKSARQQEFEPAALERVYGQIPEEKRRKIRIFLSYASEDRQTVRAFYERLARAGFSPWMDSENILPGERWEDSIQRAIESADFVMSFISKLSTQKRGYVQKELKTILRLCEEQLPDDIYFIPVKIDNCEIPATLKQYQWLMFGQNNDGWNRLFEALVEGFRRKQD